MSKALRALRIAAALSVAAICALLIWQAVDIYLTGNAPENFSAPGVRIEPVYSRSDTARRLGDLAPALWALLAVVAADLAVQAAAGERGKPRALVFPEDRLKKARAAAKELPGECRRLERTRRAAFAAAAFVCVTGALVAGAYLMDPGSFSSLELESVMGAMLIHVTPWAALALGSVAAALIVSGRCAQRELEILKPARATVAEGIKVERRRARTYLRLGLYAAAVGLIALGVANGGLWDVLVKAINICTECIGLG